MNETQAEAVLQSLGFRDVSEQAELENVSTRTLRKRIKGLPHVLLKPRHNGSPKIFVIPQPQKEKMTLTELEDRIVACAQSNLPITLTAPEVSELNDLLTEDDDQEYAELKSDVRA